MYFDIGANEGKWSLANIKTTSKIISVEACSETYMRLQEVCNNDPSILTLNYAVCNNDCKDIVFNKAESHVLSTLNKDWLTNSNSRFYNVSFTEVLCKSITFDKLIELYGIPDIIKVDVEGGEYMCISSLNQKVNILCFEWASETNPISFMCLDHLYKLGFCDFYIQLEDNYTFRPTWDEYYTVEQVKLILNQTIPKFHWGMIWCR